MAEFHGERDCWYGNDVKYPDETVAIHWGFNLREGLTKTEADAMLNCLRRELDVRGFYSGAMK